MTEKRFIQDGAFILQKENRLYETWVVAHNEHYAEIITEAMNLLYQENEQLRTALKELKEIGDYQADRIRELSDENEQLKSFKDRVFNLFAKEIKEENELLDYYIKEKAPYHADRQQIIIGVLKRLQKELEE